MAYTGENGRLIENEEDTGGAATSGSYSPTCISCSNGVYGIIGAGLFFYSRVGDIVTLSGAFNTVPVSNAVTNIVFSLPIASAFTQQDDLAGSAGGGFAIIAGGACFADTTSGAVGISLGPTGTGGRYWAFTCQYIVK